MRGSTILEQAWQRISRKSEKKRADESVLRVEFVWLMFRHLAGIDSPDDFNDKQVTHSLLFYSPFGFGARKILPLMTI